MLLVLQQINELFVSIKYMGLKIEKFGKNF